MSIIDLSSEEPIRVKRLGAVVRASRDHPGVLGLYTYHHGATEIDTTRQEPALTLADGRAISFEADPSGALVVTVQEITEPPPPGPGTGQEFVTRGRITWTFDRATEAGQYANGDWWAVGPVNVVAINPASTSSGRIRNGSMLSPTPALAERTGADSLIQAPLRYDPALNVGLGISPQTPLVLQPGQSLCSTVSYDTLTDRGQATRFMAVLTCVAAPPATTAFRPPYTGLRARPEWDLSRVDRSRLGSLEPVSGAPRPQDLAPTVEHPPWGDYHPGWIAGNGMAPENSPTYGRDISSLYGECALALHLDHPLEDKEELLLAFIQRGIDLYGILVTGGHENWLPNGGHASGRKWPILFAGLMLDDPAMIAAAQDPANAFGEDWQTFHVAETSPGVFNHGYGGYDLSWVGRPEWGIRHRWQPSHDSKDILSAYRTCCTANAWGGFITAALVMRADGLWAHPALFEYYHRYVTDIFPATGLDQWQLDYSDGQWVVRQYLSYMASL